MAIPLLNEVTRPITFCVECKATGVLYESPEYREPTECNDGTGRIVTVAVSKPLCAPCYAKLFAIVYPGVPCPV